MMWDEYSFSFQMIVGNALQLDATNKHYRVTVDHGRESLISNMIVHKTVGTTRSAVTPRNQYGSFTYWSSYPNLDGEWWKVFLNSTHMDAATFHIAFDLSASFTNAFDKITVYEGFHPDLTSIGNAIEITGQVLNQDMDKPGSGYAITRGNSSTLINNFTFVLEKGGTKELYIVYPYISIDQTQISYGSALFTDEVFGYASDWADETTSNNITTVTYMMSDGYPANASYFLRLRLFYDGTTSDSNRQYVKKAVEGHFTTEAAAADRTDIKNQLFPENRFTEGAGFQANFSGPGKNFTVFTTDNRVFRFTIVAVNNEKGIIELPGSGTTLTVNRADGLGRDDVYRMVYQHESYVAFGYQTIFYMKDDVKLDALKPTFTASHGATVYAGGDGTTAGTKQESGVSVQDFSKGPIQYSVASEDGKNQRNYWVSFVKQHTGGSKPYVIYEECDKGNKFREVFLINKYDNRHDIFLANIGDAPLTNLSVTLSDDAKNIKLDDYWRIGGKGNDTLAAFNTVTRDPNGFFELPNVAKVRLLPDGDGEVSGTLTIKADGHEDIVINLQGYAGDPKLMTDDVPEAVKFVPYGVQFLSNNKYWWNTVTISLTKGKLPLGLELKANGEIYGAPRETGTFNFAIKMVNSDPDFKSDEKSYTLIVHDNSDENIEASIDVGYEIETRIDDMPSPMQQVFVSLGEFAEFEALWLNGVRLIRNTEYKAEEGSTVITIFAQTFSTRAVNGKNTIAGEFRNAQGELRRVAQNFNLASGGFVPPQKTSPSPGPKSGGGGGKTQTPDTTPTKNYGDETGSAAVWNELINKVSNNVGGVESASGGYDYVVQSGKKVVVPAKFFETLKGTNDTVMFNTGAGVTFSISGGNIPVGFDNKINLSLSDSLKAPAGAVASVKAGAITSIEIPMESRESFGMAIGTHFNVGAANAGNFANLYRYNETTGGFEYLGSFEINDKGQAMFGITGGADYVLTVTTSPPNQPIVSSFSYNTYIVQPGDTMGRIAARHGLTLGQLLNLNPAITNPNRIRVGQVIRVR